MRIVKQQFMKKNRMSFEDWLKDVEKIDIDSQDFKINRDWLIDKSLKYKQWYGKSAINYI